MPIRLVTFYLAGVSAPDPPRAGRGTLTGRLSYRIEPGSVWIASDADRAAPAALQGYYTGLTVKGGSLDLSQAATMSGAQVIINATADAVLHLDLDQPAPRPYRSTLAGTTLWRRRSRCRRRSNLRVPAQASSLTTGEAASHGVRLHDEFQADQPGADMGRRSISQILVPYSASDRARTRRIISRSLVGVGLCTVERHARRSIRPAPAGCCRRRKVDPLTIGAAAGIGAMCRRAAEGLSATWKDLKGAKTALVHPAVIVDPGC